MKKPLRKDYPSHQAWVAAMDKFNAAKPKRIDYKSHAEWVAAVDEFNKASKNVKVFKKVESNNNNSVKPVIKSVGKTDFNVSTVEGKKAYEIALKNSKTNNNNNNKKVNNNGGNGNGKTEKTDTPKYKQVTQEELDAKVKEIKNKEQKLKIGYRRTKGEGIEGKGDGYRGDTRITKKLKKSGFTETRLAKLRAKNAEFQAAKKDKKKMKAYKEKYGK